MAPYLLPVVVAYWAPVRQAARSEKLQAATVWRQCDLRQVGLSGWKAPILPVLCELTSWISLNLPQCLCFWLSNYCDSGNHHVTRSLNYFLAYKKYNYFTLQSQTKIRTCLPAQKIEFCNSISI